VYGTPFLDRKSRTRKVSWEYRDPITRRPVNVPGSRRRWRRAMKALRMRSPRSGCWFSSSFRASGDTSYTSQSPREMALTGAGLPHSCDTSPVNSPGPRVVKGFGGSSESSTISTLPDLTT